MPANHPANKRRGGVIFRNDLSFDGSIVVETTLRRKKIFFTILYRSPASNYTSEFQAFLSNFKNLSLRIKAENPIATYFTGDFNAQSDGGTTPKAG